ncbi:ECF subfamily RNA polymerase sigma factor, BldN family [Streptomyces meridianus]|uniref:Sigma-70 family RNA polymerase sigma factor n=1 Tax=Streptomyces meridianus TaxID=2938945 RepID=A0ABT0X6X3_9ACTN|nr:ECF subfamily RNA polymerase sigma factor, BldN family [Streptomyces meridianus]MCM2578275.1 sigma-70 family RNA polymerase sigma factor [Streptomyces meridianus]
MYPHVGVDASGLATLRATVVDQLRDLVPTASAVPAFTTPAPAGGPAGPAHALADSSAAVGRRLTSVSGTETPGTERQGRHAAGRRSASTTSTVRRPADHDSRRMMDLVERAQAGEAEAFGRLYDQYADTVYRYIYYRVGGKATAEDLTSETFLRALRRIGTFTWQGRDFGAWLVTIARNLVADHFKSSRFRLEVTTGEMLDANEVERSPEDSVLEHLSNTALLEAVRRLNPQQQECVTLRFLQGLSVAETARAMGKNEGAIKTLQYRAVRTLARLLPDDAR